MNRRPARRLSALLTVLFALTLSTLPRGASAGEFAHERKGLLLGFGTGSGGSGLAFERNGIEQDVEAKNGRTQTLRIGYGLSNRFTLSLEGTGFSHESRDRETKVESVLLRATWYPWAGGFFASLGVGGGQAEFRDDDLAAPLDFERDTGVVGLGLGYEWRLGRAFALGLAVDAQGHDLGDFDELREVALGNFNTSMLLNWYL